VGSGLVAEGAELVRYTAEAAITDRRHEGERLFLTVQYSNKAHPEIGTFQLAEFMVFCLDPETGQETDLLYATLGDYRQPVPAYNSGFPASVWSYPIVMVVSSVLQVTVTASPGLVTWEDLQAAIDRLTLGVMTNELTLPLAASGGEDLLTDEGTPILAVYHPNQCGGVMAALNALEGELSGRIARTASDARTRADGAGRAALAGARAYTDAELAAHDVSAAAYPSHLAIVKNS